MVNMSARRLPLLALAVSGVLWGTSAPLTKLALGALDPGWLAAVRFVLAGLPLLWVARAELRRAATAPVALWGAAGYGLVVALWNAGLARTSVSHGALLVAGAPAMVAVIAWTRGRGTSGPRAWLGYLLALIGVGFVALAGDAASSPAGDLLVIGSMLLSATFTVAQPGLLAGRDPLAVTAVQFLASAAVTLPAAALTEGLPALTTGPDGGASAGAWSAVLALVITGTLLPFTLFAWAQARTSAEVAGAFLNLEPLVGAGAGAVVFGDPFGPAALVGSAAVLGGIALSALPGRAPARPSGRVPGRRDEPVELVPPAGWSPQLERSGQPCG
jgi:drug/metabolite transporter (DMT)-like permease